MARSEKPLTVVDDAGWLRLLVHHPYFHICCLVPEPACRQGLRPSTTTKRTALAGRRVRQHAPLRHSVERQADVLTLLLTAQPAQAAPRSIQVVVHVDAKSPPVLHMPQIHEAVCIRQPDGYANFAPIACRS